MALTKTPIELSSTPGIVDNSNATAITIDSSERVLIGKTATGLGASGTEINPNGYIQVTEDQSPPLYLNRLSTDGNIVNFYKDIIQIGCERHTRAEWLAFTDCEIAAMGSRALEFWNRYKNVIVSY